MKSILDLTSTEAKEFFLKDESYFKFDLPQYFKFAPLLAKVSEIIGSKELKNFCATDENKKPKNPRDFENVNYKLLANKDGEYSWRLYQLIHPALYVSLVHTVTKNENWEFIVKKFKEDFQKDERIKCESLPLNKSDQQKSNQSAQISHWWETVEQESIKLALEFEYIFCTDIVDCYGSLYTHSIPWALHSKDKAKKKKGSNKLLGNRIDKILREMAYGQTNGIPQGSSLMDFVAEIVLGYIDCQLINQINKNGSTDEDYKIIRFRDDYRIFVNSPKFGKWIVKELSQILEEMGMKLSPEKTSLSNSVIEGSIKPDKLAWLKNSKSYHNLQKQLLVIQNFGKTYRNSGTLIIELGQLLKRIEKKKKMREGENTEVLVSILVDIAFQNPRTYPVASSLLSKFISFMDSDCQKIETVKKIQNKFNKLPNTEHLDIWLQRITSKIDRSMEYESGLCKKLAGIEAKIWETDWLKEDLKKIIVQAEIISEEEFERMSPVISYDEVALFLENDYY